MKLLIKEKGLKSPYFRIYRCKTYFAMVVNVISAP